MMKNLVLFFGALGFCISAQANETASAWTESSIQALTSSVACCCENRGRNPDGTFYYANCSLTEVDFGGKCSTGYTFWTRDGVGDTKKLAQLCALSKVPAAQVGVQSDSSVDSE